MLIIDGANGTSLDAATATDYSLQKIDNNESRIKLCGATTVQGVVVLLSRLNNN